MDCIDGVNIHDLQKEQMYIEPDIVKYFAALTIQMIELLHQDNIIYRDLKTENLVIESGTGNLKLVDYGFAKFLSNVKNK